MTYAAKKQRVYPFNLLILLDIQGMIGLKRGALNIYSEPACLRALTFVEKFCILACNLSEPETEIT